MPSRLSKRRDSFLCSCGLALPPLGLAAAGSGAGAAAATDSAAELWSLAGALVSASISIDTGDTVTVTAAARRGPRGGVPSDRACEAAARPVGEDAKPEIVPTGDGASSAARACRAARRPGEPGEPGEPEPVRGSGGW